MPRQKKLLKSKLHRYLFFVGILLVLTSLFLKAHNAAKLSFSAIPADSITETDSQFTQINVPNYNISLPIYETTISKGIWEIHPNGVSQLRNSAPPIFYGHNTTNRFSFLNLIKTGEKIKLTNTNGEVLEYEVNKKQIVNPNEVDSLLTGDKLNSIVLYTCTGLADLKRLIVYATLISPKQ